MTYVCSASEKGHALRIFCASWPRTLPPEALEHWFATDVVREHQALGAFDAAGVFLIDGPPTPSRTLESIDYKWVPPSRGWESCDALLPQENKVALYYKQRYGMFALYEYQELLLTLREGARRKLLGKTRRLRRAQHRPPDLPWRPE